MSAITGLGLISNGVIEPMARSAAADEPLAALVLKFVCYGLGWAVLLIALLQFASPAQAATVQTTTKDRYATKQSTKLQDSSTAALKTEPSRYTLAQAVPPKPAAFYHKVYEIDPKLDVQKTSDRSRYLYPKVSDSADCKRFLCAADKVLTAEKVQLYLRFDPSKLVYETLRNYKYLSAGGPLRPRNDPEHGESGYSDTYYGKVDPLGERTTLAGWKTVNGFDNYPYSVVSAEYINAYDLGFGRDMNCLDSASKPCYVTNYIDPKGEAGGPTLAATVAMERITRNSKTLVAFYVFDASGARVNRIALDSEGPKAVPESCYACHQGYTTAGGNPAGGTYLPWDLDILESWPGKPSITDQREDFRRLNKLVWADANSNYSRANFTNPNDPSTFTGYVTTKRKQSVVDLIEGWYNGSPYTGTHFSGSRLPKNSWYSVTNNSGTIVHSNGTAANCAVVPMPLACKQFFYERSLYKNVYESYCRTCHVAHGPTQDMHPYADGLEFPTAGLFEAYAKSLVCSNGSPRMPHAELTDLRFKTDILNFTSGNSKTPEEVLCNTPAP